MNHKMDWKRERQGLVNGSWNKVFRNKKQLERRGKHDHREKNLRFPSLTFLKFVEALHVVIDDFFLTLLCFENRECMWLGRVIWLREPRISTGGQNNLITFNSKRWPLSWKILNERPSYVINPFILGYIIYKTRIMYQGTTASTKIYICRFLQQLL